MPARKKAAKRGRPPLTAAQKAKNARSTKYQNRPSQSGVKLTAKKKKRLVKRRKKNVVEGFYPNPTESFLIATDMKGKPAYYTGVSFNTTKKYGCIYTSLDAANKVLKHLIAMGYDVSIVKK